MKGVLPAIRSLHTGEKPLRYSTTSFTELIIYSISSSLTSSPMLSLNEPCATSCTLPIARRTWLGSSEPDVHALPDDACMPLSSRSSRSDSPSIPSKQKLTFPGHLLSASPLSAECGISFRALIRLSLCFLSISAFSFNEAHAYLRAVAIAAIPGTFSVPARLPFSCAPPSIILVSLIPFLAYRKPTPLGP